MLTVLESINLSAEYLAKKGIESPKLNAELLLAHILNCRRLDLYLSFDRPLKQHETDAYRELLKRRAQFEPLQYILGNVEFFGMNFKVSPAALIPRPETEILVETILNSINKNETLSIIDIGTGSGIIAVSLAKHIPLSSVTALDISWEALALAQENAIKNDVLERISFCEMDFAKVNVEDKYDIIVSNPPYVSIEDYEELRPELKVYEPKVALTDNGDGLDFYRKIVSKAPDILKGNRRVFFELGQGQCEKVRALLEENNFINITVTKDYLGIERVISGELNCLQ